LSKIMIGQQVKCTPEIGIFKMFSGIQ
jgi:hypothetical protein